MGSPQPLNTFEQKIPSFEPRISKAMRIQRVVFPDKQQFIKNLLCFAAGAMYVDSETENSCGFIFLLHNIPRLPFLCKKTLYFKEKVKKLSLILLRN